MEVELPSHFRCSYELSGALVAVDDANHFALHISGITIRGKDPSARDLCVASVLENAAKIGTRCESLSAGGLVFYRETKSAVWDDGPGVNEFWYVGFGNRELVVTLSYLESERGLLALEDLRATTEVAIRSVRLTYPEKVRDGDLPDVFDFVDSQRLWFDQRRADIAARVRKLTGYDGDGLVPLDVLDEYWNRFIETPPDDRKDTDAVLNGIAVMLGDHLVCAKSFAWAIVSDAYGVCLAVVAMRGTANVNTDPFNFVAKRWHRKESSFLVEGFRALCKMVDDSAAEWSAKPRPDLRTVPDEPVSPSPSQEKVPWWKIWRRNRSG